MRIAYFAFVEIDVPNAALVHTREIAEQMAALGCNIDLFLPKPLTEQSWSNVSHRWIRWWGFDRPKKLAFFLESACRIFSAHRKHSYDLLYVREMERNPFLIPLLRLTHLPMFIEVNGWLLDDLSISGASTSHLAAAKAHQQEIFRSATGIIVSASGNAKTLATYYDIPENHIYVQELGANPHHFCSLDKIKARLELKLPLDDTIILFAGSFHPHHSLRILIESFGLVLKEYPQSHLVLVGTGAQLEHVKQIVKKQRIQDHVTLPGARGYEEIPIWFQAADIGVLPLTSEKIRRQQGCMALKLWEYMAAGLPVVATDLPTTPTAKLLADKALLVPPDEPLAMSNALSSLLQDTKLRQDLSTAGRNYVLQHRSWRRAAKDTLAFLTKRLEDYR
jgi:glycosyltransferase involved in cell wall biosynthesis